MTSNPSLGVIDLDSLCNVGNQFEDRFWRKFRATTGNDRVTAWCDVDPNVENQTTVVGRHGDDERPSRRRLGKSRFDDQPIDLVVWRTSVA